MQIWLCLRFVTEKSREPMQKQNNQTRRIIHHPLFLSMMMGYLKDNIKLANSSCVFRQIPHSPANVDIPVNSQNHWKIQIIQWIISDFTLYPLSESNESPMVDVKRAWDDRHRIVLWLIKRMHLHSLIWSCYLWLVVTSYANRLLTCEGRRREVAKLEESGRRVSANARLAMNINDGFLVDF